MADPNARTEFLEGMEWLPPVEELDDLPSEGIREGHLCVVLSEQAVYEYRGGAWVLEVSVPGQQEG